MTELKPCPFCGDRGFHLKSDTFGHIVKCKKCGSRTDFYASKGVATRHWNTRVNEKGGSE